MTRYNIMSTPAIVIDGKVVMKGKVPSEAEVKAILKSLTPDPSPIERGDDYFYSFIFYSFISLHILKSYLAPLSLGEGLGVRLLLYR